MASAAFAIVARCAPRCRERVMRPGERRRHDVRMHHTTHTAPAPQGPLHAALHAAQPRSRPRPSAARPRVLTAVSSVPRTRAASGHGPSATSVATRARTRRASARHSIRTCSARTTMHCAANSDVRARDARRLDVPPRYHPRARTGLAMYPPRTRTRFAMYPPRTGTGFAMYPPRTRSRVGAGRAWLVPGCDRRCAPSDQPSTDAIVSAMS